MSVIEIVLFNIPSRIVEAIADQIIFFEFMNHMLIDSNHAIFSSDSLLSQRSSQGLSGGNGGVSI